MGNIPRPAEEQGCRSTSDLTIGLLSCRGSHDIVQEQSPVTSPIKCFLGLTVVGLALHIVVDLLTRAELQVLNPGAIATAHAVELRTSPGADVPEVERGVGGTTRPREALGLLDELLG
ncbi:hypothetical protein PG984_010736 [Apiospora sp. TS-2023a]